MEQLMKQLNKEQIMAVQHLKGPCMVYAGPGSGKTTVLTYRIAYLTKVYDIDPSKILVITFTKSAAQEMKDRYEGIHRSLRINSDKSVSFGTFHSIFFKIIRSYYKYDIKDILNESERYHIIKNIMSTLEIENYDDELIKDIVSDIGLWKSNTKKNKNEFITKSLIANDFFHVLQCYEDFKQSHHKIDFDDMLTKCYELLLTNSIAVMRLRKKYEYIMIDEFQDINDVQFEIVKLLAEPYQNLFVVGDEDQSIYSFRGANPHFILDFHKIYPDTKKIILKKNYRSKENLITICNKLITQNRIRTNKTMEAFHKGTEGVIELYRPNNKEEENKELCLLIKELINRGYNFGDIAVVYRTNLCAMSIVDYFLNNQIPFISRERIYNIYDHWMIKDITAYFRGALNLNDSSSIKRIINRPTRYITYKAMEKASEYHKDFIISLKVKGELQDYQIKNIERLEIDLKTIKNLNTKEAIGYIRKDLGYDDYVRAYCLDKQIAYEGLIDILNEVEEASSRYVDIQSFVDHVENIDRALRENNNPYIVPDQSVELLTMHSAKGLEFKVTIIVEALEEIIPHSKSLEENKLEEERRLFYVAATRAKERLYIYSPLYRYDKKAIPSRFIEEMGITKNKKSTFIKGQELIHKFFGKGRIKEISNKIIKVYFYDSEKYKELDIKTCLENDLIS